MLNCKYTKEKLNHSIRLKSAVPHLGSLVSTEVGAATETFPIFGTFIEL